MHVKALPVGATTEAISIPTSCMQKKTGVVMCVLAAGAWSAADAVRYCSAASGHLLCQLWPLALHQLQGPAGSTLPAGSAANGPTVQGAALLIMLAVFSCRRCCCSTGGTADLLRLLSVVAETSGQFPNLLFKVSAHDHSSCIAGQSSELKQCPPARLGEQLV
jgi:hypothetical protein